MTNKEIIKALECCIEWETPEDCGKCPYKDTKGCVTEQRKNALDLINRQQAEIERLKEDNFIKSQKRANIFEIKVKKEQIFLKSRMLLKKEE